jgi:hypothetical protein
MKDLYRDCGYADSFHVLYTIIYIYPRACKLTKISSLKHIICDMHRKYNETVWVKKQVKISGDVASEISTHKNASAHTSSKRRDALEGCTKGRQSRQDDKSADENNL